MATASDVSIYVEVVAHAPMDALWSRTQTPALHEKWDLRFSRIEYLPKGTEPEPQRFLYSTRIGFWIQVNGEGESIGERGLADGSRSSSLRFASSDSLSIIRDRRMHQHVSIEIQLQPSFRSRSRLTS
jgi:hypothetical protein